MNWTWVLVISLINITALTFVYFSLSNHIFTTRNTLGKQIEKQDKTALRLHDILVTNLSRSTKQANQSWRGLEARIIGCHANVAALEYFILHAFGETLTKEQSSTLIKCLENRAEERLQNEMEIYGLEDDEDSDLWVARSWALQESNSISSIRDQYKELI